MTRGAILSNHPWSAVRPAPETRSQCARAVLVENNYFKDVQSPHQFMYDWHMYIAASGNIYDNTTGSKNTGARGSRGTNDPDLNAGVEDAAAFTPRCEYALDDAGTSRPSAEVRGSPVAVAVGGPERSGASGGRNALI